MGITFFYALLSVLAPLEPWATETRIDVFRHQAESTNFTYTDNSYTPPDTITDSNGANSFTCPQAAGKFPYQKDCSKYIQCVNGKPSLLPCPEGLRYDSKLGCTVPTIAVCPDTQKTDFICTEKQGRYQYLEDCHKYYECEHGDATIKKCLGGLEFDAEFGCVFRSSTCNHMTDDRY